jgi:hypothetical protein
VDTKLNGGVSGAHQGSTYRRIEVITGEVRRRRWNWKLDASRLEGSEGRA